MKSQHALLSWLGLTLVQASSTPLSRGFDRADADPQVVPGAYIVELEDNESGDAFYSELKGKNVRFEPRLDLSNSLFKGVSFQLEESSPTDSVAAVNAITSIPKVRKLWPVRLNELPDDKLLWVANAPVTTPPIRGGRKRQESTDKYEEEDTFSPHVMTQVDKLRAEGFTGKGIRIGVVDTGIDYKHPALGGCFGEGCLVSYGYDLVGDDYTGRNTPVPDNDPQDCAGHGTHVSGIIAAQENELGFTGAAPDVSLGMYRVFGCDGSAGDDVLIDAFLRAFDDGSDIITASIGGPMGWSEAPWAVVASRIVDAGVPVTISAGNSGSAGLFYASTAADGKGVTAVGSVDNTEEPFVLKAATFTADDKEEETFGWTPGRPVYANITLPLWSPANSTQGGPDGCEPLPDDTPDLADYMVLVRQATCSWITQAENIAAKGGKYIMMYVPEPREPGEVNVESVDGIEAIATTTFDQGAEWIKLLNDGANVTVEMTNPEAAPVFLDTIPNNATAGLLSLFTSWGPTWEVDVKPQVATPGGMILSTWPLDLGAYAAVSGTSMACPLLAGIYALIAQARETLDPATLNALVSGTASARVWAEDSSGRLAPVPQQGAGLVQAHTAAHATTLLSVTSISFNDTDHFVESAKFSIRNLGNEEVSFEIGHVAALTMYTFKEGDLYPASYPNPIVDKYASLSFSEDKVSVPAGGSAEVTVVATPPEGLNKDWLPVYSGYITLNGTNEESLTVPYLGVVGSMHDAPTVIDPDWVYLSNYTDYNLEKIANGTVFTVPYPEDPSGAPVTGVGYPATLVQLNVGTTLLQVEAVPVDEDGKLGDIIGSPAEYPVEYTSRRYYISAFTGMLRSGKVAPEGSYVFRISALKIFGDREKEDDWERFYTNSFVIKYKS